MKLNVELDMNKIWIWAYRYSVDIIAQEILQSHDQLVAYQYSVL